MTNIKTVSSSTLFKGKVFDLVEDRVVLPDGKTRVHITVKHPGAVVIVPQAQSGALIMVHQYRHSVGETIFEFPAGTLVPGEDPLACAKRELREETGRTAINWTELGNMYPAPGFCSELQRVYFASGLAASTQQLDEDEVIEVVEFEAGKIEEMISQGVITDGKSIAGFFKAKLKKLI
ncbi:MAG: NUDIX hydrolase [Deltaproteobacteria bacterium]|nr:NUDIX hydrolase [Deltaproteobacteria bacterium]